MTIIYRRQGGMRPPPHDELLLIDDEADFTLWRSVVAAPTQPPVMGRFAGRLDADLYARIRQAMHDAAAEGSLMVPIQPDSIVDEIILPGARAVMGTYHRPQDAWGELVALLRPLFVDLIRFPRAVVALEIRDGGRAARLVHQGTDALPLDLGDLRVQAILWKDYTVLSRWSAPAAGHGASLVQAGPGWSLDLPFEHGFEIAPGTRVAAYASFRARDGERIVLVSLQAESLNT